MANPKRDSIAVSHWAAGLFLKLNLRIGRLSFEISESGRCRRGWTDFHECETLGGSFFDAEIVYDSLSGPVADR